MRNGDVQLLGEFSLHGLRGAMKLWKDRRDTRTAVKRWVIKFQGDMLTSSAMILEALFSEAIGYCYG